MSGDLLFHRAPTGPDLVFGDEGDIVSGAATATLDADFDPLALHAFAAEPLAASMDADFGEQPAQIQASYDHNVSRPIVGQAATSWQAAHGLQIGRGNAWTTMARAAASAGSRWQDARRLQNSMGCAWTALTRTRSSVASGWQEGRRVRSSTAMRWQNATRTRHGANSHWQDAVRTRTGTLSRWQDMDHSRRLHRDSRWQDADPLHAGQQARTGTAKPLPFDLVTRWQNAIVPPPGISPRPVEPGVTPREPDANLVFAHTRTGPALVFGAASDVTATFLIPIRRTYIVLNTVTLRRTDSCAEVQALSLDVSIDRDSWTWTWSADVAYSEWPALASLNGEPLELEATVNGYHWRLMAEGAPRRSRAFGKTTVRLQGRGLASELDEPVADVQNFYAAESLTAQQLMAMALTTNGASLGWSLDWQIADWTVPGGIWSLTGAPIAGVLNVAEAVKAVIQADRSARTLHILPRYKAAPWAWSSLTPDIEIPPDILLSDETEPIQKPAYNAIYVAGQRTGKLSRVYRAGTAADKLAQMVSHPLLTDTTANRQRGIAELSDTGRMAQISITLPVSEDTGLLEVGQLASLTEPADPWRGLITATGISARYTDGSGLLLTQTATLERHYA